MKTKIALFFSLLLVASLVFSQTSILPGDVSGTWDIAGSPYLIEGDINIPVNQQLDIRPGVEIEFQGYYKFEVFGIISAIGTEADTISIRAKLPLLGHRGLRILTYPANTDTNFLKYCHFTHGNPYGDYPDNCGGAIAIDYLCNVTIDHCVFINNKAILGLNPAGGAICTRGYNGEISNCTFIGNESMQGGAIMFYEESNGKIMNCYFEGNTASEGGGAICSWVKSSPQISGNEFVNNQAAIFGGAIDIFDSCFALINENYFQGNAANLGGAICLWEDCSPSIIWNEFNNNEAYYHGGALTAVFGSNPLIKRNLIIQNFADSTGGAIELWYQSQPILINNTIVSNHANSHAGGISVNQGSSPLMINNIIWNNTSKYSPSVFMWDTLGFPGFFNNDIEYGIDSLGHFINMAAYKNNIDEDPNFIGGLPFDYHLNPPSPCIDAGHDTVCYDPDNTISDLGVYYCLQTGIFNYSQPSDQLEVLVYPNPVIDQCVLVFDAPVENEQECYLSIFNLSGALIDATTFSGAGYDGNLMRYNTSHLPPGTYFMRIKLGEEILTKKIIKR